MLITSILKQNMEESKYNSLIEKTANQLIVDNISPDEQDVSKLQKYKTLIQKTHNINDEDTMKILYESLLYLKLKNSDSVDPLQHGDQFGAGFS